MDPGKTLNQDFMGFGQSTNHAVTVGTPPTSRNASALTVSCATLTRQTPKRVIEAAPSIMNSPSEEATMNEWASEEEEDVSMNDESDLDDSEEASGEDSESDEFAEWPWLKAVRLSSDIDGKIIGSCHGKIINRGPIRGTFYEDIEEPTEHTSAMGFDLFDRWGNLKVDFFQHDIKKGSGVWGKELNQGDIFLIEEIAVQKDYRRKGHAKKFVSDIWAKAQELSPRCKFAITRSGLLWSSIRDHYDKLPQEERSSFTNNTQLAADAFWRACDFRRIGTSSYFGLARDPTHPSHALDASSDHRRLMVSRPKKMSPGQQIPYNEAMVTGGDESTLAALQVRLELQPQIDQSWLATDESGGNLMHMLAETGKPSSLQWLMKMPFANRLRQQRNLEGEMPLETLEANAENLRIKREFGMMPRAWSDNFVGHAAQQVACMTMLRDLSNPSETVLAQLTYGCTCGECIAGFLSPRLAFALICQGEVMHDTLLYEASNGNIWLDANDHCLEYVHPSIQQNMRTNKSLRIGFCNFVGYVAEVLNTKRPPTVAELIAKSEGEWPPHTRNFLQRGGTPMSAVLLCFDLAMDQDIYLGDGHHQEVFGDDIEELPECRNDREFVFARKRLGVLQGLKADEMIRSE